MQFQLMNQSFILLNGTIMRIYTLTHIKSILSRIKFVKVNQKLLLSVQFHFFPRK